MHSIQQKKKKEREKERRRKLVCSVCVGVCVREKEEEEGDFQPRAPGFLLLLLPGFTSRFPPLPEGSLHSFIFIFFYSFETFKYKEGEPRGGGVKMSGRLIEMSEKKKIKRQARLLFFFFFGEEERK